MPPLGHSALGHRASGAPEGGKEHNNIEEQGDHSPPSLVLDTDDDMPDLMSDDEVYSDDEGEEGNTVTGLMGDRSTDGIVTPASRDRLPRALDAAREIRAQRNDDGTVVDPALRANGV